MKKILLATLAACTVPLSAQAGEKLDNELALINSWLDVQRQYDRVPAFSWAAVKDQDLLTSGGSGFADIEAGESATAETIYGICSISKLFTGIAALQLRDAGKHRLDDPVSDLLPWFNIERVHADSPPITLQGVLTHSSGLPRESDSPYWSAPDFDFPSREALREKLGSQKTLYPASHYFQYSNLGLSLAGEVVAEQSGTEFEEYIRKNVLAPMGLNDTDTGFPTDERESRVATGYSSPNRAGEVLALPRYDARAIGPAAGFASTALDLARFASWQLRTRDGKDDSVLSQNTLKEMQRVHWMDWDFSTAWGLAFGIYNVDGRTLTGHSGSCPGFNTRVYIDPITKTGAAVMANRNNAKVSTYAQGILNILEANGTPDSDESNENLAEYAGSYNYFPWGGEALVFTWNEGLAITFLPTDNPISDMDELEHVEGDVFRHTRDDGQPGHEIRFERDDEGRIKALWEHSTFAPRID